MNPATVNKLLSRSRSGLAANAAMQAVSRVRVIKLPGRRVRRGAMHLAGFHNSSMVSQFYGVS